MSRHLHTFALLLFFLFQLVDLFIQLNHVLFVDFFDHFNLFLEARFLKLQRRKFLKELLSIKEFIIIVTRANAISKEDYFIKV